MGQLQNLGALMIQSSRGRKGLLAIKSTLSKAKSKGLLGGALGGLKTSIHKFFMVGGDLYLFCLFFCSSQSKETTPM